MRATMRTAIGTRVATRLPDGRTFSGEIVDRTRHGLETLVVTPDASTMRELGEDRPIRRVFDAHELVILVRARPATGTTSTGMPWALHPVG